MKKNCLKPLAALLSGICAVSTVFTSCSNQGTHTKDTTNDNQQEEISVPEDMGMKVLTDWSGKSNAVFRIVEELMKNDIPFLVVEPAKGEYKNVFGRLDGVSVYGTNEKKTNLLRLNPFWFNDDVNVLEHIDKLIEVFNASWSMYAAMPAVLKAGIENAYKACGWDLEKSVFTGEIKVFPTFEDVLGEFNKKMDATAYKF